MLRTKELSAARGSRALGAMFFTIFGEIWLELWNQRAFGLLPAILALTVVLAVAIFAVAMRQYRQHRSDRDAQPDTPERRRASRIFNIVNVTQWVAILVVGNVLANIGLNLEKALEPRQGLLSFAFQED